VDVSLPLEFDVERPHVELVVEQGAEPHRVLWEGRVLGTLEAGDRGLFQSAPGEALDDGRVLAVWGVVEIQRASGRGPEDSGVRHLQPLLRNGRLVRPRK